MVASATAGRMLQAQSVTPRAVAFEWGLRICVDFAGTQHGGERIGRDFVPGHVGLRRTV